MLLGDICTRGCKFCHVKSGNPKGMIDVFEPENIANAVKYLQLEYVVLTSVDRDGTLKGFDKDLVKAVSQNVSIPVIASGGFNEPGDFVEIVNDYHADAVAVASALHFEKYSVKEIKEILKSRGINVR